MTLALLQGFICAVKELSFGVCIGCSVIGRGRFYDRNRAGAYSEASEVFLEHTQTGIEWRLQQGIFSKIPQDTQSCG
jgi:hypothetical protein